MYVLSGRDYEYNRLLSQEKTEIDMENRKLKLCDNLMLSVTRVISVTARSTLPALSLVAIEWATATDGVVEGKSEATINMLQGAVSFYTNLLNEIF